MRRSLLILLIGCFLACTVLLTGCIRIPSAVPELHATALRFTPPPGMAGLYILHQKEWASHDMPFMVSLDTEFVGSILAGQYIFGAVEPGQHELWLKAIAKSNTVRFNAEPGQVYFFNSNIPFMSSPKLQLMDEAEGRRKTSSYDQSTHNDLLYPITRAARFGQKDRVQSLLAAGEDANAKDWWGKTALIWAVERGDAEIVRLLIDHGAVDVFKVASDELVIKTGFTALKMADIKKELIGHIALSAEKVRANGGKVWKLSKPQTREKIVLFEGMPADLFKVAVGRIELGVVSVNETVHEYAFLPPHSSTPHSEMVKVWASDVTISEFYKPDTGWKVKTCIVDIILCPKIDVIGSSKYGQRATSTNYSFPINVSARIGMGLTPDLLSAKPWVFIFNAGGELQDVK
jgi:hypothetical protein